MEKEEEKEEELRGCLLLLILAVLKSTVTVLIGFILTCPLSLSFLCPNFSVSVYLSVFFPPLPLPLFLSLRYSTSFLSPVKVTPNRTSSASVTSSVSSRGSSPGLESFNTKVTPDEMSDGGFYYYCNN